VGVDWKSPPKSAHAYTAPAGTLLAKLAIANPIAPPATAGVITLSVFTPSVATGTGMPGYYRITTNSTDTDGSTVVAQGRCIASSAIAEGGIVSMPPMELTDGAEA
jgi:hypothetical protein